VKHSVRVALRWLIVAVLLALALFVALGPRPDTEPDAGPDPAGTGPPGRSMDLNQLRARAALQPCPAPAARDAAAPAPTGPLAGVVLPCLGTAGSVDLGAEIGRASCRERV